MKRSTMKAHNMCVCVWVPHSVLFILRITNGNSSSAISAPSQWSNRIILRFNHTAFWATSQLILMYCIPGFNPIQNHSGWSLKCQLGLIPGIKYTSVTRRHFVLVGFFLFFRRGAERRAATWGRCGITISHRTNPSLCLMGRGYTKNVSHMISTKLCCCELVNDCTGYWWFYATIRTYLV